jgi:hypothetical protein
VGSVNKVILVGEIASAYHALMSIPEIATAYGLSRSRVRTILIAEGVQLRTRADGVRLSKRDGRGRGVGAGKYVRTAETRAKLSASRIRSVGSKARGLSLKPSGYVEVTRGPDKGRGLHVVLMEELLGRSLSRDEVVHHKDHNRSNNELANLELMTRSNHTRMHRLERLEETNGKR